MQQFLKRLSEYLETHCLFRSGMKVGVAFSGGVDSHVLLRALLDLKDKIGIQLLAVHINHRLRGASSEKQELFVREVCKGYEIPCEVFQVDVRQIQKEKGLSMELAAREVRLKVFRKLVSERKVIDCVATGHNLDDRIETVLINFFLGKGLRAISGIQPKWEFMVHPLLWARRKEIEHYAREHQIQFYQDESNLDRSIFRNFIRHEVIKPLVERTEEGFYTRMVNQITEFEELNKFLISETLKAFQRVLIKESSSNIILEISGIKEYFSLIRKYLIFHSLERLSGSSGKITRQDVLRIEKLLLSGRTGACYQTSAQIECLVDRDRLILATPIHELRKMELEIPGAIENEEFRIEASKVKLNQVKYTADKNLEFVDAEYIGNSLKVRSWKPGDRFKPLGLTYHRKLSDFFVDHRVSLLDKKRIPILVKGEQIVWVVGLRLSEDFKITEKTREVIKLEYIKKDR